ncbi:MAG: glycosyltransferase family 9 protein [Verrucomicrobiota bacterium]
MKDPDPTSPQRRYWIRLPNWLGDVVMAIPVIAALRKHDPEVEITVLAQSHFAALLEQIGVADRVISIPQKGGLSYFAFFYALRRERPDAHILLTNSTRGDLEAVVVGAKERLGISRRGKRRPLLTRTWSLPEEINEGKIHQTNLWGELFSHLGISEGLDCSAREIFPRKPTRGRLGLICATENSPEKRWPVSHWRQLIEAVPEAEFQLFGTPRDLEVTSEVASGFSEDSVVNRAGKTGLMDFAEELCQCEAVICNDTGGMHLANMLGVPVIAIFGPTNPIRTGPIFDSPKIVIQPSETPPTGGAEIGKVSVEQVLRAVSEIQK